jgi:hypothetical protein
MDASEQNVARLFGATATDNLRALDVAANSLAEYRYTFMPLDVYESLIFRTGNVSRAAQVYWTEMVARAHLAAVTTIMRTHRWVSGTVSAIQQSNYLAFAASLRRLLEAVADSYYTVGLVPEALAGKWQYVKLAVTGQAPLLYQIKHSRNS